MSRTPSKPLFARRRRSAVTAVAASAAAGVWAAPTAHAANYFWDPGMTASTNGGGTGSWDKSTTDWFTGAAPDVIWTDGNTAIFNNTAGTVTLNVPISALGVELLSPGYSIVPSATNTLTLTSNASGAASALYVAGGGPDTVGGPLVFTAATTNTNFLTVNAGSALNLTGSFTSSAPTTDALTVTGGGTVNFSGTTANNIGKFAIAGGTTFNVSGTLAVNQQTYLGVSDALAGTALNVTPGGTLAASGLIVDTVNGTSGTFNVSGGNAAVSGINFGSNYNGTTAGDSVGTVVVTNGGNLSSGLIRLGSTKSGVGTLTISGGGAVTTSASVTIGTGLAGTGGAGTVVFNNGTFVASAAAAGISNPVTVTLLDGGATYNTSTFATTVSANISSGGTGVGAFTKLGTGTLTVTGSNTYTGNTAVSAGTLLATTTGSLPGYTTTGKISVANGAELAVRTFNGSAGTAGFASTDIDSIFANVTLPTGSTFGFDTTNGNFSYGSNIVSPVAIQKLAANNLFLTGTNTYTGGTLLTAGVLAAGTGSLGTGAITFNGGGIASSDATARTFSNVLTQAGAGSLTFGLATGGTGNLTFTDTTPIPVGTSATRNLVVNNQTTLNQGFTGTGLTSTKSGVGTLILAGNSTGLTGAVSISAGALQLANSNALGTATITISGGATTSNASGGTLQVSGGVTVANTIANLLSRNDPLLTTTTAQIENVSGANTITSNLTDGSGGGLGIVVQSDAGTLTLSGNVVNTTASSYARPLIVTGPGNVVTTGNFLAGTGNTAAAATNGTTIFKEGTGTLSVNGTGSTFFNAATIFSGTLQANAANALGSGTTLVNGGVLAGSNAGGTASTGGPVTLGTAGTVTAGTGATVNDTVGLLTTGTITGSGGLYAVKITGTGSTQAAAGTGGSGTAGTTNDELLLSSLAVNGSGPAFTVSPVQVTAGAGGFTAGTYSYLIAKATTDSAAFDALTSQVPTAAANGTYSLSEAADPSGTGQDLFLNFTDTAAPEPTSVLLLAVAAGPLALGRRRRQVGTV